MYNLVFDLVSERYNLLSCLINIKNELRKMKNLTVNQFGIIREESNLAFKQKKTWLVGANRRNTDS